MEPVLMPPLPFEQFFILQNKQSILLTHVKRLLGAIGQIRIGEKGEILIREGRFQPSGGELLRSVSQWDYTWGYTTWFLQKGIRKITRQNCNKQIKNIQQVSQEILRSLDSSIQLLHEQAKQPAENREEAIERVNLAVENLLNQDLLQVAKEGFDHLVKSYASRREDQQKITKEISHFNENIKKKFEAFLTVIQSHQKRILFVNQSVPSSGIFLIDTQPYCMMITNRINQQLFWPLHPEKACQQMMLKLAEGNISVNKSHLEQCEEAIHLLNLDSEKQKVLWERDLLLILMPLEKLYGNAKIDHLEIQIEDQLAPIRVPRVILAQYCFYFNNSSLQKVNFFIQGLGNQGSIRQAIRFIFHRSPLEIHLLTIKDLVTIALYLKIPIVLAACIKAMKEHPDWLRAENLNFDALKQAEPALKRPLFNLLFDSLATDKQIKVTKENVEDFYVAAKFLMSPTLICQWSTAVMNNQEADWDISFLDVHEYRFYRELKIPQ